MKKRLLIIILLTFIAVLFLRCKMSQSNPEVLLPLINEIDTKVQFRDSIDSSISTVDVAWHLDHMLKTINKITDTLEISNPDDYSKSYFNFSRILSLSSGHIPRGRAQSPSVVRPPDSILTESLILQINMAKANVEKLKLFDKKSHFNHPYFGQLNKAQAIRFMEVHTMHHLKIVSDILEE
ncbi:DUF1569 domain-containing protein [Winogradskyella sp.]|uniref:DUF1569 domain-containing protein n=1 Tax=Winogradskyella sp. TaxID=1883156 RepID=UPI0026201AE2|nr:DUF1569 domain-containing protein [Winogradskyella sp.]